MLAILTGLQVVVASTQRVEAASSVDGAWGEPLLTTSKVHQQRFPKHRPSVGLMPAGNARAWCEWCTQRQPCGQTVARHELLLNSTTPLAGISLTQSPLASHQLLTLPDCAADSLDHTLHAAPDVHHALHGQRHNSGLRALDSTLKIAKKVLTERK